MSEVSMKTHLTAPAAEVWKMVGQFNGLPDWHPMIVKSELEDGGRQRSLSLPDGSRVVEELHDLDDGSHTLTYAIVDSPLPVMNYTATIKVVPDADGSGCTVEWSGAFDAEGDPNQAVNAIQNIYEAGLQNLKKMYG